MELEFIKEIVGFGSDLGNIVLAVGTLFGGLLFLWRFLRSRQRRLDRQFTAIWTNEGEVGNEERPSHYLELDLICKNGDITGLLRSNGDSLVENLSVTGARSGRTATIDISDVGRGGQMVNFGSAKLALAGDELAWSLEGGQSRRQLFPQNAALWAVGE